LAKSNPEDAPPIGILFGDPLAGEARRASRSGQDCGSSDLSVIRDGGKGAGGAGQFSLKSAQSAAEEGQRPPRRDVVGNGKKKDKLVPTGRGTGKSRDGGKNARLMQKSKLGQPKKRVRTNSISGGRGLACRTKRSKRDGEELVTFPSMAAHNNK